METKRGNAGPPGAGDLGYFAGLKDRELRDEGYFLVEGRLLVERLLAACLPSEVPGSASGGFEPIGILCVPSLAVEFESLAAGLCPVSVMGEADISALAGFPFHRGVLAASKRPELPTLERWLASRAGSTAEPGQAVSAPPGRILVLPDLIDPENLGSAFRSAAALGYGAVLLGPSCVDPFSRRALRVSMGAVFSLPVARIAGPEGLDVLRGSGFRSAAAVIDSDALTLEDWTPPACLAHLIGNEFSGLAPGWVDAADLRVTIRMAGGVDSLNAAAAATIFMYETMRTRAISRNAAG
jgi:tRNA G18 (ribose-2'-O)-methylase SpoU